MSSNSVFKIKDTSNIALRMAKKALHILSQDFNNLLYIAILLQYRRLLYSSSLNSIVVNAALWFRNQTKCNCSQNLQLLLHRTTALERTLEETKATPKIRHYPQ